MGRPKLPESQKKKNPKGKHAGRALGPVKKEQIRQTFLLTGNKKETARLTGVSYKSVYNVLQEPEEPEVRANREAAARQLSSKVHVEADRILSSVAAEDLDGHYLMTEDGDYRFDKQGRPIWVGPTLNQKIVGAAILLDKLPVIEKYRQELDSSGNEIMIMAPETVEGMVTGIKQKIARLRVLDVSFEGSEAEQKAEELLQKAQNEIEAEFEEVKMEDFDNPSEG